MAGRRPCVGETVNIDGEHTRDGPQKGKLVIVCSVLKLWLGVKVWDARPVAHDSTRPLRFTCCCIPTLLQQLTFMSFKTYIVLQREREVIRVISRLIMRS